MYLIDAVATDWLNALSRMTFLGEKWDVKFREPQEEGCYNIIATLQIKRFTLTLEFDKEGEEVDFSIYSNSVIIAGRTFSPQLTIYFLAWDLCDLILTQREYEEEECKRMIRDLKNLDHILMQQLPGACRYNAGWEGIG